MATKANHFYIMCEVIKFSWLRLFKVMKSTEVLTIQGIFKTKLKFWKAALSIILHFSFRHLLPKKQLEVFLTSPLAELTEPNCTESINTSDLLKHTWQSGGEKTLLPQEQTPKVVQWTSMESEHLT